MRAPYTQLYLHLVWSTWRRLPLITPELQRDVYASLAHQSEQLGADVLAIGGITDHVHLLVRFPTTVTVSQFVGRAKGATSHLITHVRSSPEPFKWQGRHGA